MKNEKHEERNEKEKKKQIIRRMRRKSREIPFRCSFFLASPTGVRQWFDVCLSLSLAATQREFVCLRGCCVAVVVRHHRIHRLDSRIRTNTDETRGLLMSSH